MHEITEVLTTFSSWAIAVTAIMAALAAVFKPIRKFVLWLGRRLFGEKKDKAVDEIKRVEVSLIDRIDKMNEKHDEVEKTLSEKIDEVSLKCDIYERNRLRTNIFEMGNCARKHQVISSEEFRNLQQDYEEYTELHGNGTAAIEYEFIVDYYNHSGWTEGE